MTKPFFKDELCSFIHGDCVAVMKNFADNEFDLLIADPPFGIGQNWSKDRKAKFYKHRHEFNNSIPGTDYFNECFRVSRHQIIWGCNYYWNYLPPSNNLIYWRKGKDTKKQFGSAGELAWTSFTKYPLMEYDFKWNGFMTCEPVVKIHPHQKPVKLYEQTLIDFAKPGWKILDTHLGSGSSAIASIRQNVEFFVGIEKEESYLSAALKRYTSYKSQFSLQLT